MEYQVLDQAGSQEEVLNNQGKALPPMEVYAVRCPVLVQTKRGTILSFSNLKFGSQKDEAPSVTGLRRSFDGGKNWGPLQVFPMDMCGQPVYDELRDTVVLLCRTRHWKPGCQQERLLTEMDQVEGRVDERFWVCKSTDDGTTWSEPREVFIHGLQEHWTIKCCPTPGSGIQLKRQKEPRKNGRLVYPCGWACMREGYNEFRDYLLYSDDGGDTWQVGGILDCVGANEGTLTERQDGVIVLNCRNQGGTPGNLRIQGFSYDGGESFRMEETGMVDTLYDPICHGSLANCTVDGHEYLFISLPAGPLGEPYNAWAQRVQIREGVRECLTIYVSADGGRTYHKAKQMDEPGCFASYSHLLAMQDGRLLVAWESGPKIWQCKWNVYHMEDPRQLVRAAGLI